ncbi:MAG: acyltransferase [Lachnospiraceae bacterium]|nr:acyltransferase [Lachnospiraceae bacterium]
MQGAVVDRKDWVDIYKAIAIILVVIGHATGQFNTYIYQFHVAAFFFISGWVAKHDKENIVNLVVKKFITLMIPVFTLSILYCLLAKVLSAFNMDHVFFNGFDSSLTVTVANFCKNDTVISLLGAAWFVFVLFYTAIISHLIYLISGKKMLGYMILTIALYIMGCNGIMNGTLRLPHNLDLAFVAQGYYGIGYAIKCYLPAEKEKEKNYIYLIILVASSLVMYLLNIYGDGKHLVDLAGRVMHNIGWSTLAVCNGIVWLYSLSKLLSKVNIKCIKAVVIYLGKNTMGIMLLHFGAFKVLAFILYLFNKVSIQELINLIPSEDISMDWWFAYSLSGVVVSLLVWGLLNKVPVLSVLLGKDNIMVKFVMESEVYKAISKVYISLVETLSWEVMYEENRKIEKRSSKMFKDIILLIICICMFVFCSKITDIQRHLLLKNVNLEEDVQVTFPYSDKRVLFGDGWLEQTKDEKYRWVQNESFLEIYLSGQETIRIEGYVPEGIDEMSNVKVYLNDVMIVDKAITDNEGFSLQGDISECVVDGKNTLRIAFNSIKIPKEEDLDKRSFSALISLMVVE